MKRKRPPREREKNARIAALNGAQLMIEGNISQSDAAKIAGSARGSVQEAYLVLRYGTAEEIATLKAGTAGMRPIVDAVRQRIQDEGIDTRTRSPVISKSVSSERAVEAQVWDHLSSALDHINSLPRPEDMVGIVRKNALRNEAVSRKLLAALNWITEFSDAWTG